MKIRLQPTLPPVQNSIFPQIIFFFKYPSICIFTYFYIKYPFYIILFYALFQNVIVLCYVCPFLLDMYFFCLFISFLFCHFRLTCTFRLLSAFCFAIYAFLVLILLSRYQLLKHHDV